MIKVHFSKIHWPHLRRRALLELGGLFALITFIFLQRDLLFSSVATVLEVEISWFIFLMLLYWLILPFSALSYKLIAPDPKKVNLKTTMLAHLAGSGPGRIIPGGIGAASINALHLKKGGISIEKALSIVSINIFFGSLANVFLLIVAAFIDPNTTRKIFGSLDIKHFVILSLVIIALIVLAQWLQHFRKIKKEIQKTLKQGRGVIHKFLSRPANVVGVFIIALIITLLNTAILDFSALALNINISFFDALIALSFGVTIGGVLPTPGGIGGVEAGISAILIMLGYSPGEAASVAVLFRLATYWQPIIPGTLSYLYLTERKKL